MASEKLYKISVSHKFETPTLNGDAVVIDDGGMSFVEMHPVDAVEVVRCGACKEWLEIEETGGAGYCNHPCWTIAGVEPPIVQFADFCSYGERRCKENV